MSIDTTRLERALDIIFKHITDKLLRETSWEETLSQASQNYERFETIREIEAQLNWELFQFFNKPGFIGCFSAIKANTPIWRGVVRPNQFRDATRLFSWTWVRAMIEDKSRVFPDLPWGHFLQRVYDWVDLMDLDPRVDKILQLEAELSGRSSTSRSRYPQRRNDPVDYDQ